MPLLWLMKLSGFNIRSQTATNWSSSNQREGLPASILLRMYYQDHAFLAEPYETVNTWAFWTYTNGNFKWFNPRDLGGNLGVVWFQLCKNRKGRLILVNCQQLWVYFFKQKDKVSYWPIYKFGPAKAEGRTWCGIEYCIIFKQFLCKSWPSSIRVLIKLEY